MPQHLLLLGTALTTKQLAVLSFKQSVAVVAILFGIAMAGYSVVLWFCRGFIDTKYLNFILPIYTLAVTIWLVSVAGIGFAGLCAGFIGTVFTAGGIMFAIGGDADSVYVAIGLTVFAVVIGTTLGGIDLYDLTHCLNNGALC
jgi:hypothetical protein